MSAENWKVMVNGVVYEADLEAIKQWIMEGRMQPIDRVQKGTLPWTLARNVPALREVCAQCNPPLQMPPPMPPPMPPDVGMYQMQGQMMQGQMMPGQMMPGQMMQGQQMQGQQMMPGQFQAYQA